MKNIFKMMGIALMACSVMVACGNDENETPTDTTPVTPPAPTSSVTVVWDGAEQDLGFKDAYVSNQDGRLMWFEAAKGIEGENLVFPAFYVPFWDGTAGVLPAFLYSFRETNAEGGYDTIPGNEYFPLEVYSEGGLEVTAGGETYVIGDYQYASHYYTAQPEVTFDATSLTLSIDVPVRMYDFAAYQSGNVVTKDLDVTLVNYHFDAAK